ncbi:MAG: selenocysteine-specific translation elongation factor [Anaerolineae bacterium]|nr:selenocysteine-specific translation elongation factor [Anaerolineae bacterium]
MYVIGTAGHVDHGKSTLVHALTGIDPDRLREEKERKMTIDLGFAWLTLDGLDEEIGVVDVPGHRDFIENMLAGVGGIDVALFVVAADEGVMPQTQEHLAILDLLQIGRGVVALTKVDLIDDPDWLELVTLDLHDALEGTVLADAPIVPVAAHSGTGLDDLKTHLVDALQQTEPRRDIGRPRLPIDRVFSLTGFGTVVTGTLIGGRLHLNDDVEVQPGGLSGRIRGLQTHKNKLDIALPGSRVAVNISGIDKQALRRGMVLTRPGVIRPTRLIDARYRHLATADVPLKHDMSVKLFTGSAEIIARARVVGVNEIAPGTEGFIQLAVSEPVAVARGDRFIVRRPSPAATLGGGVVLDPYPGRRHRRFRPETLTHLQTLSAGTPQELLLQTLGRLEPTTESILLQQSGMDLESAAEALAELIEDDEIIALNQQFVTRSTWYKWAVSAENLVAATHAAYPLRLGLAREELRSRLRLKAPVFNPFLEQMAEQGLLLQEGTWVRLPTHEIRFSAEQQVAIDQLLDQFAAGGINSPSVKEARTAVGDDVYEALVQLGRLQPVSPDVVWRADDYEKFTNSVYNYLVENGTVNAGQIRDLFQTSRKYAIALLEHLDAIKMTRRVGDDRELVRRDR